MKSKLPEKLSDLIDLALSDMKVMEKSKKHVIQMQTWHEPVHENLCSVCFAGGVIANTMGGNHRENLGPSTYNSYEKNRFQAIDSIRCYSVVGAFSWIGFEFITEKFENRILKNMDEVSYTGNKRQFKINMRTMARRLRKEGY